MSIVSWLLIAVAVIIVLAIVVLVTRSRRSATSTTDEAVPVSGDAAGPDDAVERAPEPEGDPVPDDPTLTDGHEGDLFTHGPESADGGGAGAPVSADVPERGGDPATNGAVADGGAGTPPVSATQRWDDAGTGPTPDTPATADAERSDVPASGPAAEAPAASDEPGAAAAQSPGARRLGNGPGVVSGCRGRALELGGLRPGPGVVGDCRGRALGPPGARLDPGVAGGRCGAGCGDRDLRSGRARTRSAQGGARGHRHPRPGRGLRRAGATGHVRPGADDHRSGRPAAPNSPALRRQNHRDLRARPRGRHAPPPCTPPGPPPTAVTRYAHRVHPACRDTPDDRRGRPVPRMSVAEGAPLWTVSAEDLARSEPSSDPAMASLDSGLVGPAGDVSASGSTSAGATPAGAEPYPGAVRAPADGSEPPSSHPVKVHTGSGRYHTAESPYYIRTRADSTSSASTRRRPPGSSRGTPGPAAAAEAAVAEPSDDGPGVAAVEQRLQVRRRRPRRWRLLDLGAGGVVVGRAGRRCGRCR